jgi:hypothetical protein
MGALLRVNGSDDMPLDARPPLGAGQYRQHPPCANIAHCPVKEVGVIRRLSRYWSMGKCCTSCCGSRASRS